MEKEKKLRVFEAFSGIGAQASALERMNINYEIVGISDWFIDAIECYAAIHCNDVNVDMPENIKEIDEYLSQFTFSATSVKPTKIKLLSEDQRRDLYRANKQAKNFGSITDINGTDMPDTDLLVYSFPCQDLSTGGLGKGMKKGSGTRSGLLWEVERILNELKEQDRLPEYLLLENVKTIKSATHIDDLNQWLSFLESIGYVNNECMLLNSLDFGIPQDRDVMWEINGMEINNNTIIRTITCNMDRTHTAALFKYNGQKGNTYRRLTIREAFLLMGFTEKEYLRARSLNYSYRKFNKLIGNSIVVNVLQAIFEAMFGEKYRNKQ